MAKKDADWNKGEFRPYAKLKKYTDSIYREIYKENKKTNPPQIGAKQLAINAYEEGGKDEAYRAIQKKYNESIGKEVYTKAMIDAWIKEYEQKKREKEQDDDAR